LNGNRFHISMFVGVVGTVLLFFSFFYEMPKETNQIMDVGKIAVNLVSKWPSKQVRTINNCIYII
jgi:hypothetical protein